MSLRAADTYGEMPPPPPPPQQQTTEAMWSRCILCSVLLTLLLAAVCVFVLVWGSIKNPHQPRFTIASLSIYGGQAMFNVSDSNHNRRAGIYYVGATRASLLFHDALVTSGPVFAAGWCQPAMNTTSIAGVLHIVGPRTADHSFSAALRAGRLPLRLQLTTAISFTITPSVVQRMHVNCDLLVGADGSLLRESVGAACSDD